MIHLVKKILDYRLEKENGVKFDIPLELILDLNKHRSLSYYRTKEDYYTRAKRHWSSDTSLINEILGLEYKGKKVVDIAIENMNNDSETLFEGETIEDGLVVIDNDVLHLFKPELVI